MTPSALKYLVSCTGSHFFDRGSMKFFGDTMANFRTYKTQILTSSGPLDVIALARKCRTPKGAAAGTVAYFDEQGYRQFGEEI